MKDWAFKKGYALTSGVNKEMLKIKKPSPEYYDNFYVAEAYGNSKISDTGFSELEAVHKVALRILVISHLLH